MVNDENKIMESYEIENLSEVGSKNYESIEKDNEIKEMQLRNQDSRVRVKHELKT